MYCYSFSLLGFCNVVCFSASLFTVLRYGEPTCVGLAVVRFLGSQY